MSEAARGPGLIEIDVREFGGKKDGVRQESNDRLFFQLFVFDAAPGQSGDAVAKQLGELLTARNISGVVYADANGPRGVGLLTWSYEPTHFVENVRPLFSEPGLIDVTFREDFTMLGRTYSLGYEPDLAHVLFTRPVNNVLDEKLGWHVWYPLRRNGAFAKLSPDEHGAVLKEHAVIGFSYGQAGLAHDVRLACHGLDAKDNEFVIGIVSDKLHPISHLVQTMRKTRQTSEFISQMGPFFVGRVVHRSVGPSPVPPSA